FLLCFLSCLCLYRPRPPVTPSTPFPYTTLFRSHPRQVCRTTGAGDDYIDAVLFGISRIVHHHPGGAVCAHHFFLVVHTEMIQHIACMLHRRPVRRAAHDYSNSHNSITSL